MKQRFTSISEKVLTPRLACLGFIKIGGKRPAQQSVNKKQFQPPTKWDHFKVTTRARGNDGNFVVDHALHKLIGNDKPTELDVRLLFDHPEQNFISSLTAYEGRKLRCSGNGEKAFDRVLGRQIPCTCPLLKQHEGPYPEDIARPIGSVTCKPYGVLSVMVDQAANYGGFHVFKTTSWETISNISAALQLFKSQFGLLSFVPFKLVVYPRTVQYEDGSETKSSTAYSVSLVLRASMDTAFQIAAQAGEKRAFALQLTSGSYTPEAHAQQVAEIESEQEEDTAEEFYGDQGITVDAEIEEIDDEADAEEERFEKLIRRACDIGGADPIKTNQYIARYAGNLRELAEIVQRDRPEAWEQAYNEAESAENAESEEPHGEAGNGRGQASDASGSAAGESLSLFEDR